MFQESSVFYWHKLLLDANLGTLFRGFHKSCVQRKIRRAIRERLEYTEGRSDRLIRQFHRLLILHNNGIIFRHNRCHGFKT